MPTMNEFNRAIALLSNDRLLVNRARFLTTLPDQPLSEVVMFLADRLERRLQHLHDSLQMMSMIETTLEFAEVANPRSPSVRMAKGLVSDVAVVIDESGTVDPVVSQREREGRNHGCDPGVIDLVHAPREKGTDELE